METLQMQPVVSSMVQALGFAPDASRPGIGTLFIEFNRGDLYAYPEVTDQLYNDLLAANISAQTAKALGSTGRTPLTSVGMLINARVFPAYTHEKVAAAVALQNISCDVASHAGYAANALFLVFKRTGLMYRYADVPRATWDAIIAGSDIDNVIVRVMNEIKAVRVGKPDLSV